MIIPYFTYPGEEMEWVYEQEKEAWQVSVPTLQRSQLLKEFPEAMGTVKQLLKEVTEEISKFETLRIELTDTFFRDTRFKNISEQETHRDFTIALVVDIPLKPLLKKQKEYKQMLMWQEYRLASLELIKEKPITDLIEFNSAGFAGCLWHKEVTPSMKYYPKANRVYCFGCHFTGDVLDVYMELFKCTLAEAITALS